MDSFDKLKENEVANIQQQVQKKPTYANDSRINNPYQSPLDQPPPINMNSDYGVPFYGQHQSRKQLKPNFSKAELDAVEIPSQIAKEIKSEKYRVLGLIILGFLAIVAATFFLIVAYGVTADKDGTKLKIPNEWQPVPALMIILAIIGVVLLAIGFVDYSHVIIAVKKYRGDVIMGIEEIPYFLIRNYKALVSRPIYLNWLAFNIYVWGGIIIGIMFIIKAASSLGMQTEIIIMIVILCVTLFAHLVSLIVTRARKGNINSYYGYEIIPFDQIKDIKKETNKICMIIFFIFLSIILLVITVPYIIVRKNKGLRIIPFI